MAAKKAPTFQTPVSPTPLQDLLEGFEDYVFVFDPSGHILHRSPSTGTLSSQGDPEHLGSYLPRGFLERVLYLAERESPPFLPLDLPLSQGGQRVPTEALMGRTLLGGQTAFVLSCRDTRHHRQNEDVLEKSEERYHTIFDHSPLGIVHIDHDGIVTDLNETFAQIMGTQKERLLGFNMIEKLVNPWMRRAVLDSLAGTPGLYEGQYTSLTGGKTSFLKAQFRPMTSRKGTFLGVVGVVEDISERREAEEQIRFLNMHDPLTGLLNRRCFDQELQRLDTPEHLPLCLIMGDVNGLKLANDAFGHPEGDILLTTIARILQQDAGPDEQVFRWGGDEFIILLPRADASRARERIAHIHALCAAWQGRGLVRPSISLGYGIKNAPEEDYRDVLLKTSEDRMYEVKMREGRRARLRILAALEERLHRVSGGEMGLHVNRLLRWCDWIGPRMSLKEGDHKTLRLLCQFHDLGLVGCPQDILDLPAPLQEEAFFARKEHPTTGYRLAKSIPELLPAADLVLSHHEQWDGRGFPQGLWQESIPFPVRLFQLLDALDVLTHPRPYDPPLSFPLALAEIRRNRGSLFDPTLADRFAALLEAEGIADTP
ncbi:diguanylate cyclase and metal dependent phosphohydrolase [Aminomonas paucivorans DSM 12260]|uniref:Diguanylate cyclase and metal dependent phosphohydrolase n=1 Tax=Aminomonas paucivorans DSM 12260 TaxID=584708 RepID=E3CXK7_9BACT|nr:diguanylate cyclase and metal dependent phosphohydrolase [Aminomonas paucivorans DSM 12260]